MICHKGQARFCGLPTPGVTTLGTIADDVNRWCRNAAHSVAYASDVNHLAAVLDDPVFDLSARLAVFVA